MTLLHHIYSWEYEGSVAQESNGNKRNDIWKSWLGYPNYGKENYKIKKVGLLFLFWKGYSISPQTLHGTWSRELVIQISKFSSHL